MPPLAGNSFSEHAALPLPSPANPTYIRVAVLRGACWTVFPGLIDLFGSCPCPCPWTWAHGAHLRCRFPGSMSHGFCGPHFSLCMNAGSKADLRRAALERRAGVPEDVRLAFVARAMFEGLAL